MKIGIPNQGKLKNDVLTLFNQINKLKLENTSDRSLYSKNKRDDEIYFLRSNDIAKLVEKGTIDFGITGADYILECKSNVKELLSLDFGKGILTLLVPNQSRIKNIHDLMGKTIATQYPNACKKLLNNNGLFDVNIYPTSGATEIYPALGLADATFDVVATGNTYKANGLVILEELFHSSAVVFCNKDYFEKNKDQVTQIITLLESIIKVDEEVKI